jgi:hypothetical protein
MTQQTVAAEGPAPTLAPDPLAYEALFLTEKLLKDQFVQTAEEAESLFSEVKKYLVLAQSDDTVGWEMYSLRVDEAWHQFILFTTQYVEFCHRFFGHYLHHNPSNAPRIEGREEVPALSFDQFRERYEARFGPPLPHIWYDAKSVTTGRRIINERAGTLTVRRDGDLIDLVAPTRGVVMSVNELAHDALAFIARTGAFYVRELPGGLTDDEKVALIATLVEHRVLRVGS